LLFTVGPIGVVIATVVSEVVGYGIRAYSVRTIVPVTLAPAPLVQQFISGVIMAISVLLLRNALSVDSAGVLLLIVAVGGLTYFGSLLLISEEFRVTMLSVAEDAKK
jgi:hypothetical protein